MMMQWKNLNLTIILSVMLGLICVSHASIANSLYGKERGPEYIEVSRNQFEKGDIIDLDDTNFDITDHKANILSDRKTSTPTLDSDSDDIDIGPYGDIFEDVEVVKTDGKSLFRTVVEDNKSDGNETTIENGVDDEDITGGSGSGDTAIEIEEDPLIFNTTQDLKISENTTDLLQPEKSDQSGPSVFEEPLVLTTVTHTDDGEHPNDTIQDDVSFSANRAPYCEETANITWAPWSPWIRAGDVDIRFRQCPTGRGYTSNVNHCQGDYIETRRCDQHDVKMCRTPNGYLTEEHHVSCDGIDTDDVKTMDELRSVKDNQESCEYTLYDLVYNMPIGSTLTTDGLMGSDPTMWCGPGEKYIPFYTQTQRCLDNLRIFCKSSQRCKYEKKQRKQLKNKGDLNKDCWRNFVLGGVLPQGVPLSHSSKLLCQRFSRNSMLGKTIGYREDHYATFYDTSLRMPMMSMATVHSLGDDKWPNVPFMIEQGLIRDDANVISWFYKDRKRGICRIEDISDTCQVDRCNLGERQATPDDFELSGYRIAPLLTPDIIGGTLAKQLSTFTLTNAAPMEPTVFSSWKKVLKAVRKFEEQECRIPVVHFDDSKKVHTSRYGHELPAVYIESGTYASKKHVEVIGNDVTVPELFWLAVCCAHGADVASFGVYVYNEFQAQPKVVSIENLQIVLKIYDDTNQTDIKLFPAFDSVCSASENNVSFKIYL